MSISPGRSGRAVRGSPQGAQREHRDHDQAGAQDAQRGVAHGRHDQPRAEARGGAGAPDQRVGDALDARPLVQLEVVGQHRAARDEAEVPAPAQQEQRGQEHEAALGRGGRRPGSRRSARIDRPGEDRGHRAEPVGQAPGDRRQREHAQRVGRQHDAHRREVVAVLGHVERRHRHDQDHHELARSTSATIAAATAGPPQDRPDRPDARPRVVVRWPGARRRRRARTGPGAAGSNDRIAARPTKTIGTRYGPDQRRQAGLLGEVGRDRHHRRADDGSDGRPPDHDPDRRRAPVGRHHVGGRVAGELVGAVAEPDQQRAAEEERERSRDHRGGRDQGPQDADRVAGREPGPAAAATGHEARTGAPTRWPPRGRPSPREPRPAPACRASRGRRSSRR